jgi:hypothetical protein
MDSNISRISRVLGPFGTRELLYHSNLERTNWWIDLLTANLQLPDSLLDYSLLFAAAHDMLIESLSEQLTTREIRLGVREDTASKFGASKDGLAN